MKFPSCCHGKEAFASNENDSVIIRIRPVSLLSLFSSLKSRKSWEEVDEIIPLYKMLRMHRNEKKRRKHPTRILDKHTRNQERTQYFEYAFDITFYAFCSTLCGLQYTIKPKLYYVVY